MKVSSGIWSTISIDKLIKEINTTGRKPKSTPFFDGDSELRNQNINFEYNQWEADEYTKICANPYYFTQTYAKVKTDDGQKIIKLRKYQKRVLEGYINYQKIIYMASRQCGKSIVTAIYIVWYILANTDKNIVLISQNGDKVKDLLDKIMSIYKNLPFWLKPGIVTNNTQTKVFDNGVKITGLTTTAKSGASFTADFLYIDEFALIDKNFIDDFWRTALPTISSIPSHKLILTSTPRGFNKFWEIWNLAINSKNGFHPMVTYWYEVPTKVDENGNEISYRDELWKKDEIANLGGNEEDFNQEYACQFLAGSTLILKSDELRKIKSQASNFVNKYPQNWENLDLPYYNFCVFNKIDISEFKNKNNQYTIIMDIGGGEDGLGDYTVFNIFKILPMSKDEILNLDYYGNESGFFKSVQIAMWRCNNVEIPEQARMFYHIIIDLFNDNIKAILEVNFEGNYFLSELQKLYGDNNRISIQDLFVKFLHRIDGKTEKIGVKTNVNIKIDATNKFKVKAKNKQLIILEQNTVNELMSYAKTKSGSYASNTGHDDTCATLINQAKYMEARMYLEQIYAIMDGWSKEKNIEFSKEISAKMDGSGIDFKESDGKNSDMYSFLLNGGEDLEEDEERELDTSEFDGLV